MSGRGLWVDERVSNAILKDYLTKLDLFAEINNSGTLNVQKGRIELCVNEEIKTIEGKDCLDDLKFYMVVLVKDNAYRIAMYEGFVTENSGIDVSDVPLGQNDSENEMFVLNDGGTKRLAIWVGDQTESFLDAKITLALHCNLYI